MYCEYDAGPVQTDWDPGNLEMSYIPGLAQVPGTNPATGAYAYFASDHLGTVRGVYNQSKAQTAAMDYSPYGEPNAWRGNVPATTYTGHYFDGESGMYFAPYRYYMPDAGRWLTRDPLGMVDGPNVYLRGRAAPNMHGDRLGLYSDIKCWIWFPWDKNPIECEIAHMKCRNFCSLAFHLLKARLGALLSIQELACDRFHETEARRNCKKEVRDAYVKARDELECKTDECHDRCDNCKKECRSAWK